MGAKDVCNELDHVELFYAPFVTPWLGPYISKLLGYALSFVQGSFVGASHACPLSARHTIWTTLSD